MNTITWLMLDSCTQRREASRYLGKDEEFLEFVPLRSEARVPMLHSSDLLQILLRGHRSLNQQAENKNWGLVVERNTSLITEVIFQILGRGEAGGNG